MAEVIICLDDQPALLKKFRKKIYDLDPNVMLIVTCRSQEFLEYINGPDHIIGILVKFDLPFGTGYMFSKMLKGKLIPVIITENDKYQASKIFEAFNEIEYMAPIDKINNQECLEWEDKILSKLGF
jgi:hypothetical protein